jgi:uncharacterized membrane protein YhiD involved in acid resistance
MKLASDKRREVLTLLIVFTGVLLISAAAVYVIGGRGMGVETTNSSPQPTPAGVLRDSNDKSAQVASAEGNETFIDRMFGTQGSNAFVSGERWVETMGRLTLRLLFAALLGAALAFRPRKRILALKRNPYVSQTQILLAIVAAALMIIVGDNAARAFGIFAAVSLVRFRTNIRDPKEITVLLISLALGLASGVGRWDLALVLAVFSLIVLWLLEWREPQLIFRSMELKVSTKNVIVTQQALRTILRKHGFDKELRAIDREATEESPGSLVYSIDISPMVSTDELSEDILKMDGLNVEAIEWDQKKSFSYMYQ